MNTPTKIVIRFLFILLPTFSLLRHNLRALEGPQAVKLGDGPTSRMARGAARPYVRVITPSKDGRNEDTERAARKELHNLRHEGAELGGAVSAMAKRTATHFAGDNERDPIELWGK